MKERCVDRLGRIVIPKDYRIKLGLFEGTPIRFRLEPKEGVLILEKAEQRCIRCGESRNLVKIGNGFYLCAQCIRSLKLDSDN